MMATQTQTTIPAPAEPSVLKMSSSGLVPYRLTVRQFEKMIDAGIFRAEDRVELLGGLLIKKMTVNDPHDFAVSGLAERRIEVYSSPTGRGKAARYRDCTIYGADQEVPEIVDGQEVGRVKVSDIV